MPLLKCFHRTNCGPIPKAVFKYFSFFFLNQAVKKNFRGEKKNRGKTQKLLFLPDVGEQKFTRKTFLKPEILLSTDVKD